MKRQIIITILALVWALWAARAMAAEGGAVKPFDAGVLGAVQISPDENYVFMRARAGGGHSTPYGFFAFRRDTGQWQTLGNATNYGKPVSWNGKELDPEALFYSRSGYEQIQLGNNTYHVAYATGQVVINVTGLTPAQYFSDPAGLNAGGEREYLFKYVYGSKLWFDMRVRRNKLLSSEGVGCFDTADHTFQLYSVEKLGFKPDATLITRMTGDGGAVMLGVSFCDATTCVEDGAIIAIDTASGAVTKYTAQNAALPHGAVLDIVPDGGNYWVGAAYGVSQWRPGAAEGALYRPSQTALVTGAPRLRLSSGGQRAAAGDILDGTPVTLVKSINLGFVAALPTPVIGWAWLKDASGGKPTFIDDGATLVINPDTAVTFFTKPDTASPLIGVLQYMGFIEKIKVLERRDDWVNVDLTDHVWIPAQNLIIKMESAQRN